MRDIAVLSEVQCRMSVLIMNCQGWIVRGSGLSVTRESEGNDGVGNGARVATRETTSRERDKKRRPMGNHIGKQGKRELGLVALSTGPVESESQCFQAFTPISLSSSLISSRSLSLSCSSSTTAALSSTTSTRSSWHWALLFAHLSRLSTE